MYPKGVIESWLPSVPHMRSTLMQKKIASIVAYAAIAGTVKGW